MTTKPVTAPNGPSEFNRSAMGVSRMRVIIMIGANMMPNYDAVSTLVSSIVFARFGSLARRRLLKSQFLVHVADRNAVPAIYPLSQKDWR